MARVNTVNKAMKDQGACGRCGTEIKKGDAYRHASPGFRAPKIVRCMAPGCAFRSSELTQSKMAGAYAAQEDFEDSVPEAEDVDSIKSLLEDCANAIREVAEEYREASSNWGDFGNEEWDGYADELEAAADEIEEWEPSEDEPELEEDPEDAVAAAEEHGIALSEWIQQCRDEASETVNGVSFG